MKRVMLFMAICLIFSYGNADAFVSGSTGADGEFNPTENTELQLPPDGVFNFSIVNVPAGVTVTFSKNATNTPVYILATGNVVIDGTININGTASGNPIPGRGGPGGYDGGVGSGQLNVQGGNGLGPGGGSAGFVSYCLSMGGGGSFATTGGNTANTAPAGPTYGNEKLIPLTGGSGGGGGSHDPSYTYGGGGGGGAILIASSTSITVNGSIVANGGNGYCISDYESGCPGNTRWRGGGSGSGGAIRLMANAINGSGTLSAKGGYLTCANYGGKGRIRLETYVNDFSSYTNPPYTLDLPDSVFPVDAPALSITSIAGVAVPASPAGSYARPDITLPTSTANPVTITLAGANIPVGTNVTVSVLPQYGSASEVAAILSGTDESSTASADVSISTEFPNVIRAEATFAMQTAMFWNGEKIDKVRVASTMGGDSGSVYITEAGNEIEEETLVMAGLLSR